MADELRKLKNISKQAKSTATRFGTYLNSIQSDNISIHELKARQIKLEDAWNQYMSVHAEIEALDETDQSSNDILEFENTYFNLIARSNTLLLGNDSSATSQHSAATATSENETRVQVRLPKIELPHFSGSYEDWYNFHDTFNALIHSNNAILPIEKFHYLKSSLKSEAAEILQSLELTDSNYECAWEMLRERYDNKRIIIQRHIKAICELSSTTKESYAGIRHILDGVLKHVRALKSLKRPAEHWDDILIYIITNKLDSTTNKAWETSLTKNTIPTLKDLTDFLSNRCQVLDAIARTEKMPFPCHNKQQSQRATVSHIITSNNNCSFCNENHNIYKCNNFLKLSVNDRIQRSRSKHLCLNCLRAGHTASNCRSSSCRKCSKRHNTLLHLEPSEVKSFASASNSTTVASHCSQYSNQHQILLSTARIYICDHKGQLHECRALLDSGSQSCFITDELARRVGLNKSRVQIPVAGINQSLSHVNHAVNVQIKSRHNAYQATLRCLVLNRITENLPVNSIPKIAITIPKNIKLADPDFNISKSIDMLIGAELFWNVLCVGQIKTARNQPYLQKTHFGWIVSGPVAATSNLANGTTCNLSIHENSLESKISQFWQLEEYAPKPVYTPEQEECEKQFKATVKRNDAGKFIVNLPVRQDFICKIGNSRENALKRFYALERKLCKQPELRTQYCAFIHEYLALGHMKLSSEDTISQNSTPCFYLPHHAVLKEDSLTTKLRVVFDGSAKSSSGISLNDALLSGPVLQEDLLSIVLRFRTHKFVLTADIAKMYRQVLVDESQTHLQRILWRNNPQEEVQSYDLLTVTYGTSPASFLAIRAMHELAHEERSNFPTGSAITIRDFYVDDLLTGADSLSEAETIRDEVNSMLKQGGFELRKWVSNHPPLVRHMFSDTSEHNIINLDKSGNVKTLGLQWNAHSDTLQYSVPIYDNTRITKRTILSAIAQIFDPLGLIGPVIIVAKILMQQLWQLKLSWDESVPASIHTVWFNYRSQINKLNKLTIPRWINNPNKPIQTELHGFSDASELAYGACIYMRITSEEKTTSTLICAKSRVAPLKNVSLPRLELCGALLLARLMNKTINAINMRLDKVYYWTDSTVTLAWITSTARTWKTFVANRVSEIQGMTNSSDWHHVPTAENPADVISRGQTPEQLLECSLWWNGPHWLTSNSSICANTPLNQDWDEIPEQRVVINSLVVGRVDNALITRYSCMNKCIRVIAYCLRFRNNTMHKVTKSPEPIEVGPLTANELNNATHCIIKMVQQECFRQEFNELSQQHSVHSKSKLLCLNPFLDEAGLIRVGGRLRNSDVSYDQGHPILLPKGHPITTLIIRRAHINQLHAGAQNTLAAVRTKYWPLGARSTVRRIVQKCIVCFKTKPVAAEHIMGDLPASHITPSRPFLNTGVDYFGPFSVREGKRRNSKLTKAYGAIFICFATKAVHLELVTDLSSEAFINTLKRFMARRGMPQNIYSVNGTNFVGANRELKQLRDMLVDESNASQIKAAMAQDLITWHFIPPRAPHFGGLWEAAVKSTKHHLRRIIGNASMTYEEISTLLAQIEAILNSRPLTPLSNDPNDLSFLTPGHFLIGDSLTSTPEPNILQLPINRLSRWQHIEQLRQHFWSRWSKEYLGQLQQRSKWKRMTATGLEPGRLVLIREDNTPPLQWPMGRVDVIHPGPDGVIRAATIRTAGGTFKRPTTKLCPLPIDSI